MGVQVTGPCNGAIAIERGYPGNTVLAASPTRHMRSSVVMLIEFRDANGSPVYINPQYVIALREEKH